MLQPKRVKRRKAHRGKMKGNATRGNTIAFGDFGIQALEHAWVNSRQIEAGRIAGRYRLKDQGRIWIRIFPHKPITATPAETRMGKGKGSPIGYIAVIRPGTVLYEVGGGISEDLAKESLNRISHKMPMKTKMLKREKV